MHSLPDASMPWPMAWIDRYIGPARWTAVSGVVADRLRRSVPAKPVDVLHNGVDPDHWRQPRRPGHPLTIVSTMRLARRKRPLALLRTLSRIRELVPARTAIRAIMVGEGPQAKAVAAEARGLGLTSWVDLPGRLTRFEIQQLYASADIYLAPAELESFGVAALEARCAGLPVVAMASGGVGEFIRHGVEGYLVDSDAQMAQAVAALLTSPALLSRLQDHNYTTDPGMTWEHVVAQHVAAYRTQVSLSALPLASAS
jgi:glycosyltransferase involved in cell wall biosynthesis